MLRPLDLLSPEFTLLLPKARATLKEVLLTQSLFVSELQGQTENKYNKYMVSYQLGMQTEGKGDYRSKKLRGMGV